MPTIPLTSIVLALTVFAAPSLAGAAQPQTIANISNPESAVEGPDGRVYVSEIGQFDKDGDGRILVIDGKDKVSTFAEGLNDPKGLATWAGWLYVADKNRVVRIDKRGRQVVIADAEDFPRAPLFLNDLEIDDQGSLYVSDSGDLQGTGGAIYRIDQRGKVRQFGTDVSGLGSPNGLLMDGPEILLVVDVASGNLYRMNLKSGVTSELSGGYGGGDGLARDALGRTYVSDYKNGRVFVLKSLQAPPRQISDSFQTAADIAVAPDGKHLLVPDMKAGELIYLPLPD